MPASSTAAASPTPNCFTVGSPLITKLAKTQNMINAAADHPRAGAEPRGTASRGGLPPVCCCSMRLIRNTS